MSFVQRIKFAWRAFRTNPKRLKNRLRWMEMEYTEPIPNDRPTEEIVGEQNKRLYKAKATSLWLMQELGMDTPVEPGRVYQNPDENFPDETVRVRKCGVSHNLPCGIDEQCELLVAKEDILDDIEATVNKHEKRLELEPGSTSVAQVLSDLNGLKYHYGRGDRVDVKRGDI